MLTPRGEEQRVRHQLGRSRRLRRSLPPRVVIFVLIFAVDLLMVRFAIFNVGVAIIIINTISIPR